MPDFKLVDRSGTLANAGSAAQLLAADQYRRGWRLMNNSAADIWFNDTGGTATANAAGSYRLAAGDFYESPANCLPSLPVSIVGTAAGQVYSAAEW